MNIAEIIGTNIKSLLDNETKIIKYAKVIGVTRQTASRYISGESCIDAEKIYITAKYFDKRIEWFFESEHKAPLYTEHEMLMMETKINQYKNALEEIFEESLVTSTKIKQLIKL